jgi:hypothetical protein
MWSEKYVVDISFAQGENMAKQPFRKVSIILCSSILLETVGGNVWKA